MSAAPPRASGKICPAGMAYCGKSAGCMEECPQNLYGSYITADDVTRPATAQGVMRTKDGGSVLVASAGDGAGDWACTYCPRGSPIE